MIKTYTIAIAVACWIGSVASTAAAEDQKPSAWLNPQTYFESAKQGLNPLPQPEFFEMLTSIIKNGADMGPGEAWFHPSESRFNWAWLAARCKKEKSQSISRKEFPGSSALFDRLDRNHDGVITAADMDWSDRSPFARLSMPASQWFRMYDANSNGKLSKEEWLGLFQRAAKGRDYLTADDLREMFPTAPPPRPANQPPPTYQGPSRFTLLTGLFGSELGSPFEGPHVNQLAPDFALKTFDGKRVISLSQFRGHKPVVLIFGSFS